MPIGALHRIARTALGSGGTVLDVGCGGGAASVPLVPPATRLAGVDSSPGMLRSFATAAEEAGVSHEEVLGEWPDVSDLAPLSDVVVCRNVVYNVPSIVPFAKALTRKASKRVVVELTEFHPSVALAPLWVRFWGIRYPNGPTADMFVEVLSEMGYKIDLEREVRPSIKATSDPDRYVEFARRRLCLDPSRDADIAAALAETRQGRDDITVVIVSWQK
ncbi:MAG TPA: methyltransferase domain-containing protein [Acidimicrobiales bacterium]|nr:methyltransferase domain-containing protein [Acidimicrobiales bacterium]